ncbi:hypothetical protein [Priestia megaterium]|uniref:hypothetical protein n=1 Tax=Priestia megaterium TaxID=1404 RepID=UPI002DBB99D9|nr:hypothetical protein [Priestia megaterium]MEC1067448.1 hypothetical protein [Priestia megaterium]
MIKMIFLFILFAVTKLCLDLIKDSIDLFFDDIEAYLQESETVPAEQKLKEVISSFICFREKKAQLLTGVEETKSIKSRAQSPLYVELHQILVQLFDEMRGRKQKPYLHSAFKADMMLMALSSDSYFFQKNVRGYSPEEILNLLCSTFISD